MAAERELVFAPNFLDDLRYWSTAQPRFVVRVLELVEAAHRDPFSGIGKPEPLRHVGPNTWSRRLDDEHRIVYQVEQSRLVFVSARGNYT